MLMLGSLWAGVSKGLAAEPLRSRVPVMYLIDYSDRWFTEPDYAGKQFGEIAPDIVHVGKAVPITHLWGPIPYMAGENQRTGGAGHTLDRKAIRLLSPRELEAKVAVIEAGVQRLHKMGVRYVIPYISTNTLAGDAEKGEGFWEFYQQWEVYEKWLGPRPATNPSQWLALDGKGRMVPPCCGGHTPAYLAPLKRYRTFLGHPDWNAYLQRVTRLIAQAGYDGVFPDNASDAPGVGPLAEELLQAWLKKNYTPDQLEKWTGKREPGQLALGDGTLPPWMERRFRVDLLCDHLRGLREAGRAVNPEFAMFPNGNVYQDAMAVSRVAEFNMQESTPSPGRRWSGPLVDHIQVLAADAPPVAAQTARGDVRDENPIVELDAQLVFPVSTRVGQPCELTLEVNQVGASSKDNDFMEQLHLRLVDMQGKEVDRVTFLPELVLGGSGAGRQVTAPPATLKASWTPRQPGSYRLLLSYRYSDPGPGRVSPVNSLVPIMPQSAQTQIGEWLALWHAQARQLFLDYEATRSNRQPTLELALAQAAAFGRGGNVAVRGAALAKYGKFFRQNSRLYDNLDPYGQVGLLFSFWGPNQGSLHHPTRSVADQLTQAHILPVPLLDHRLEPAALRGLKVVYLVAGAYDLTQPQIQALLDYVKQGGRLEIVQPSIRINQVPVLKALSLPALTADKDYPLERGLVRLWQSTTRLNVSDLHATLVTDSDPLRSVRLMAYIQPDSSPRRMVVHVLNYNIPLQANPSVEALTDGLAIRLPLPSGAVPQRVTAYDPDDRTVELPFETRDGFVHWVLPSLRIYKVVQVDLR